MRGTLGQMGEVFNIIKINLTHLAYLKQGKLLRKATLYNTSWIQWRDDILGTLYQTRGSHPSVPSHRRRIFIRKSMKRYLSKIKRVKEIKKDP